MQLKYRTEVSLEGYKKCQAVADNDCSLGQIYDFACALKAFILQKIQEADQAEQATKEENKE